MKNEMAINKMVENVCKEADGAVLTVTVDSKQEYIGHAEQDVAEAYYDVAAEAIRSANIRWKWVGTHDRLLIHNAKGPILLVEDDRGWSLVVKFYHDLDHPDYAYHYNAVRAALPKAGLWWKHC